MPITLSNGDPLVASILVADLAIPMFPQMLILPSNGTQLYTDIYMYLLVADLAIPMFPERSILP